MQNTYNNMNNFAKCMQKFAHLPYQNGIAIAVSGGADSMSLAIAMNEWCKIDKIPLYALTVDHRLRPDSTAEALLVKNLLSAYQINHHILTWNHVPFNGRLQEKARQARYQLLEDWCNANAIKVLATAHHAMDQWETFMMRLSKGSYYNGLSGMLSYRNLGKIWLIRPYLSMLPKDIHINLKPQQFVNDPSNSNERFERIRWRKRYKDFANMGLDTNTVLKVTSHMQSIQGFLNEVIQQAEIVIKWDLQTFCLNDFYKLHPLVGQGFLQKNLQHIGQTTYPCSQSLLQSLYKNLMDKDFKAFTAGNCLVKLKKNKMVAITKENRNKISAT